MPWSTMADMAFTDDEKIEQVMPIPMDSRPDYPPGLRICLTEKELEKLGLEADCEVGDVIDLRAFACVCSVSKSDGDGGSRCRVELQIEKLAIENESTEEPDEED